MEENQSYDISTFEQVKLPKGNRRIKPQYNLIDEKKIHKCTTFEQKWTNIVYLWPFEMKNKNYAFWCNSEGWGGVFCLLFFFQYNSTTD